MVGEIHLKNKPVKECEVRILALSFLAKLSWQSLSFYVKGLLVVVNEIIILMK